LFHIDILKYAEGLIGGIQVSGKAKIIA